ncbi:putative ABC transporter permease [Enterococcus faecalis]|uniref:putative ABC transporter permease n=1 Tax=Enterococcus faecalis TaxID=1351 RepID=UPI001F0327A2
MEKMSQVILLFFIYSFIGWLWETVYCSLKAKKFVYRGFLVGPYCPIYGFGVLSVLYFVEPFENNLLVLYVGSAVLVTILEYITSYGLEKLFHASWWDYHDVPFNLNGRVALPVSLFWGLGCVLIVKVIQPEIAKVVSFLQATFGNYLALCIVIVMGLDLIYTLLNMQGFKKLITEMGQTLETNQQEFKQRLNTKMEIATADWQKLKKRTKKEHFQNRLNFQQRRFINNYPKLTLKNIKNSKEVRHLLEDLKKKGQ